MVIIENFVKIYLGVERIRTQDYPESPVSHNMTVIFNDNKYINYPIYDALKSLLYIFFYN